MFVVAFDLPPFMLPVTVSLRAARIILSVAGRGVLTAPIRGRRTIFPFRITRRARATRIALASFAFRVCAVTVPLVAAKAGAFIAPAFSIAAGALLVETSIVVRPGARRGIAGRVVVAVVPAIRIFLLTLVVVGVVIAAVAGARVGAPILAGETLSLVILPAGAAVVGA